MAARPGRTATSARQSWNPNLSFFGSGAFIGDYNGFAAGEGVMYPVWTDGRNSPRPAKRGYRHLDEHGSGPIGRSGCALRR